MKKLLLPFLLFAVKLFLAQATPAQSANPQFSVLAFYSTKVEADHVMFSDGALKFFADIAAKDNFSFTATANWDDLNDTTLAKYQIVVWLNDEPSKPEQKRAFQTFIEHGGAWLGFHVSAYNDKDSNWPWFVNFLGGGVFSMNDWPPLPARLTVDDKSHPVTAGLPLTFMAPANEWYIWQPSPRLNKDVRVLVTLDPSNYPLGFKDILKSGDLPVVWTNTKYKMLYMNMGHGDKIFTTETQNRLFENGLLWLGGAAQEGPANSPTAAASSTQINPHAIVANPASGKVYAVNTNGGTVTIIDAAKGSSVSVRVGEEPVAIAVNAVTNKIYVGNAGSGTVSVIDGTSDEVAGTVTVGSRPYAMAVNSATNKIYVSRTFGDTMTIIDGATNSTSKLKPNTNADAMEVNAGTNKIYFTNYESKALTVMDGESLEKTAIPADVHLWGVAINPTSNKIYFPAAGSAKLFAVDGTSNYVTSIATGEIPCCVAIDTGANRIYVANYASNSVTAIDGNSETVLATIPVGTQPHGLAVNSATHTIYVANTGSNNVSIISGANNKVVATVDAGPGPFAIAVEPNSGKAFVATMGPKNVVVIDSQTSTKKFFPSLRRKKTEPE